MWESIKNKFKRKKHVEEVEEAVVNEEEQAEEKTDNFIGFMYIISRLFCKNGNSNKSKNASVRLLFFQSLSTMFT